MRFNCGLQFVADRAPFGSRTTPRIDGDVRRLGRIAVARRTIDRVRRKEELHALDVSGWCAVPLVHVTATNPLRSRRHSDLVASAVITDCSARGVRTMKEIVAWERRIVTARIPGTVVNGIVPIVIVIGRDSVPAAIVWFERVMCPANAGICTGNNDVLPCESEGPYLRCVRIVNPGLDRCRTQGVRSRVFGWPGLRKVVVNERIAFYSRHLRSSRQRFG